LRVNWKTAKKCSIIIAQIAVAVALIYYGMKKGNIQVTLQASETCITLLGELGKAWARTII